MKEVGIPGPRESMSLSVAKWNIRVHISDGRDIKIETE